MDSVDILIVDWYNVDSELIYILIVLCKITCYKTYKTKGECIMQNELKIFKFEEMEVFNSTVKVIEFPSEQDTVETIDSMKYLINKLPQIKQSELFTLSRTMMTNKYGYVYFIYNENTKLTKIGYTKNISKRIRELKSKIKSATGEDHKLVLKMLYYSSEVILPLIEKEMHTLYGNKRKFGEWFNLTGDDIMDDFAYEYMDYIEDVPVFYGGNHDYLLGCDYGDLIDKDKAFIDLVAVLKNYNIYTHSADDNILITYGKWEDRPKAITLDTIKKGLFNWNKIKITKDINAALDINSDNI